MTIEMSGAGLEFVHEAYPRVFDILRSLVISGRLELISSLYTPNIWVAYPRRDLIKSVELNQQCLEKLHLPWSRVFFAQESFFGQGVATLTRYFDVAICRDDLLSHYFTIDFTNPCFKLNGMKTVAASNHLLNDLQEWITSKPDLAKSHSLYESHVRHIKSATLVNVPGSFPAANGTYGELQWHWYHCGDGNHFGSIYKPDSLQYCYYDRNWSKLCEARIDSYSREGYCIGTVSDFVRELNFDSAQELPQIIESSWNPRKSDGVFCWMGSHASQWEDDCGVLTSISRARARLIKAEAAAEQARGFSIAETSERLEQGWVAILNAQVSDGLGWVPGAHAVQTSLAAANRALIIASQLLEDLQDVGTSIEADPDERPCLSTAEPIDRLPVPELYGADGSGSFAPIVQWHWVYDCQFTTTNEECGICFPFEMEEIVYCPSGLEQSAVQIPIGSLRQHVIVLPLANGLLGINSSLFIIKDTSYVHVAARIDIGRKELKFGIRGSGCGRHYHWRFHFVRACICDAIAFANNLNSM
jgi:hypothetical protein